MLQSPEEAAGAGAACRRPAGRGQARRLAALPGLGEDATQDSLQ